MTQLNQIYKCEVCGNIIEMVHAGTCNPFCCDKPMILQRENTVEASLEKHVPVITEIPGGYRVQIGSDKHPMVPEHHIEWIELMADDKVYRQYLKVGGEPVAEFLIEQGAQNIAAREYCNLHALWSAQL